jgi:hypothetical protein
MISTLSNGSEITIGTVEIDFSVKLQSNLIGFIILRDHTGNIVATLTVEDNPGFISWNCENLRPGIYFYSLEAEDQLLIAPKSILILR